jgi:SAM-dependent methyltransferase
MSLPIYKCPICSEKADCIGQVKGKIPPIRIFSLYHCPNCRFSFYPEYRVDYEAIYSKEYYQGLGADPLANYEFDHFNPLITLRQYEWLGLTRVFKSLVKDWPSASWLDYGCGFGSLVNYGRKLSINIFGYEPYGKPPVSETGGEVAQNPIILSDQDLAGRSFDFITSIEVIEHVADPLAFLRGLHALLKPGGVLFLTTGNARQFKGKMTKWSYSIVPDIHVSFFEPETLALALRKTNFQPSFVGYLPGFTDIIKYKILKNLHFKKNSRFFNIFPWSFISALVNIRYQITAMPIGIAV